MADVIGPCSTLPGSRHQLPEGTACDEHRSVPAVARVQGETDSFGAELHDLCQPCLDALKSGMSSGCCDWCEKHAIDLRSRRDFEEGSCGPVYEVCGDCVRAENKRLQEELDEHLDDWEYE